MYKHLFSLIKKTDFKQLKTFCCFIPASTMFPRQRLTQTADGIFADVQKNGCSCYLLCTADNWHNCNYTGFLANLFVKIRKHQTSDIDALISLFIQQIILHGRSSSCDWQNKVLIDSLKFTTRKQKNIKMNHAVMLMLCCSSVCRTTSVASGA